MRIVSKPLNRNAQRMAPLAVLPVFFSLVDQRVIVAGGSEAAAWKAELLAAAGAKVEIYVTKADISEEMATLLSAGASAGELRVIEADWRLAGFAGAALAVGDLDEDEAPEFVALARASGVPVNVIDKPAFCQFQFGSIVNRSPVVVSISTDGAAPILGQAVRRRIEMLLPDLLGAWGAAARAVRAQVMERLEAGPARRAFWERFVDLAFSGNAPAADDAAGLVEAIAAGPERDSGRVTLVGAGPGEAELLTVKAVRALQAADVILFDDLVSDEVLELARREARRLCVGKRGGRESCRQEDINAMMLKLAGQGKHVVRLKSGDPMIFGRAGEEIAMLEAANIPVSVVPGISAGLALAARLGVSLTHRDFAQSVRFVTGHSRMGKLPGNLDWGQLADPACTNVFYMCRRTLGEMVERLLAEGMSAATPCIIAASIARKDEQIWRGTLGGVAEGAAQFGYDAPTLFALGNALGVGQTMAADAPRESLRA